MRGGSLPTNAYEIRFHWEKTVWAELWLIWKSVFTPLGRRCWGPIHKPIFIAFSHIHNTLINYFQHFRGVRCAALASCSRSFAEIRCDPWICGSTRTSHFKTLSPGDEMMTFICLGSWSLSICVLLPVPAS